MKRIKKRGKTNYKNKGLIFSIARYTVLFFMGILYFIYFIVRGFHTIIGKSFLKLPRITKVSIIYCLIFCALFGVVSSYFTNPRINFEIKRISSNIKISSIDLDNVQIAYAKTKPRKPKAVELVCNQYSVVECKIFKKAKEHGLSNNHAYMLMAISKHETGNWTSSIYRNYHNLGGIIGSHGFRQYNSLDDGVEDFVNLLDKYYINNGRNTIELIGAKYCPVGASNDPTGLNNYWVPQVTKYYNQYVS